MLLSERGASDPQAAAAPLFVLHGCELLGVFAGCEYPLPVWCVEQRHAPWGLLTAVQHRITRIRGLAMETVQNLTGGKRGGNFVAV